MALAVGIAGTALVGATGCGDDCGEAADLCSECEGPKGNCESRFDDADSEYCAEAVRVYEASCASG